MIPENEQGVIVEFARQSIGTCWEIAQIQVAFPDAIIKDTRTGQTYRAEFEFLASNFIDHDHDIRACDLIICWENDWPDCLIPVWTMKNWQDTIFKPDQKDKEIAYLADQNRKLIQANKRLEAELSDSRGEGRLQALREQVSQKENRAKAETEKAFLIQTLAKQGYSKTAIAQVFFGTKRPSTIQIQKVAKILALNLNQALT